MSYQLTNREVTCPLCHQSVRIQKFYVHGFECPGRYASPVSNEQGRSTVAVQPEARPPVMTDDLIETPLPEREVSPPQADAGPAMK